MYHDCNYQQQIQVRTIVNIINQLPDCPSCFPRLLPTVHKYQHLKRILCFCGNHESEMHLDKCRILLGQFDKKKVQWRKIDHIKAQVSISIFMFFSMTMYSIPGFCPRFRWSYRRQSHSWSHISSLASSQLYLNNGTKQPLNLGCTVS